MSLPGSVRVAAVALLGLIAAAALAFAASRLAAQHIGLSSEPLSAGDRLAPSVARHHRARPAHATRHRTTPPATSSPAPRAATPAPTPALPTPSPPPVSSQPAQASPPSAPSDSGRETGEGRDD